MHLAVLTTIALITSADHGVTTYSSPPLLWLKGAHVRWDLNGSAFSIKAESGKSVYELRYLPFVLLNTRPDRRKVEKLQGTMNFWSTNRLISMHLVKPRQGRRLSREKLITLDEKDYVSCIINCPERPEYNVYIQFDRAAMTYRKTLVDVKRLFARIDFRK